MPKIVCFGVWENETFIGALVFGRGANYRLPSSLSVQLGEAAELCRVALKEHRTPVTRIVAIAIRLLQKHSPGVKVLVSYADPVQGHEGIIYRAGNWQYMGQTSPSFEYRLNGMRLQKRAYTGTNYGNGKMPLPRGAVRVQVPGKHKFVYYLTKRARSTDSGATNDQLGGGGANPTRALISEGAENNG